METISKSLLSIACLLYVSSCVAPQRFAKIQEENYSIRRHELTLEARNLELAKANDSLSKQFMINEKICSDAINQKQIEIEKSSRLLEKNQKIIDELEKDAKQDQAEMSAMQKDISKALKAFSPEELTVKMRAGQLYVSLSDKLLFPTGSDAINKRGKQALLLITNVLKKSNMLVMVEGHTDAVPINNSQYKDNWDLSVHRATSVTRILTGHGIKPSRIIASGRSEFDPVASNKSADGRKFNRRTEIALLPRLDKIKNLLLKDNNSGASALQNSSRSAMK